MQQPVAYQPLDPQNANIFNASTGNFLSGAPGQAVGVRKSGIAGAGSSSSSVSPGHLKLLSSSPRVFYFDRFLSATELDALRLYFERCQSSLFAQTGGQLNTLSDTTYQPETDPCVLSQRISPEVGLKAWSALANVRRRIFAQTKARSVCRFVQHLLAFQPSTSASLLTLGRVPVVALLCCRCLCATSRQPACAAQTSICLHSALTLWTRFWPDRTTSTSTLHCLECSFLVRTLQSARVRPGTQKKISKR